MEWMEETDLELVTRIRAGETDAYREIVERHGERLFRTAYRLVGSEEDADDVVQEAFLKAYRSLDRFDGRSRFGTWIYRITVNCAMDLMRKRWRRERREIPEGVVEMDSIATDGPRPDRLAQGEELGRRVGRVLATLSPSERAAFVLRHFDGYSSSEIGKILGMRSGATRNAVFRAVRKLRAALSPLMEAPGGDG